MTRYSETGPIMGLSAGVLFRRSSNHIAAGEPPQFIHRTAVRVAHLEGVDNAAEIRDLIVERLRMYRDSGLGEKTVEAREPLALSAAREVLQETRALRNSLASGPGSTE